MSDADTWNPSLYEGLDNIADNLSRVAPLDVFVSVLEALTPNNLANVFDSDPARQTVRRWLRDQAQPNTTERFFPQDAGDRRTKYRNLDTGETWYE